MIKQMLTQQAIQFVAPIAATVLTAMVSRALAAAASWIRKKTDNEAINNAITRVCAMTETTVAELSQTLVTAMKAANGGALTEADMADLRDKALALVQKRLTPEVLADASRGVTDLQELILARIERAVVEQKAKP